MSVRISIHFIDWKFSLIVREMKLGKNWDGTIGQNKLVQPLLWFRSIFSSSLFGVCVCVCNIHPIVWIIHQCQRSTKHSISFIASSEQCSVFMPMYRPRSSIISITVLCVRFFPIWRLHMRDAMSGEEEEEDDVDGNGGGGGGSIRRQTNLPWNENVNVSRMNE